MIWPFSPWTATPVAAAAATRPALAATRPVLHIDRCGGGPAQVAEAANGSLASAVSGTLIALNTEQRLGPLVNDAVAGEPWADPLLGPYSGRTAEVLAAIGGRQLASTRAWERMLAHARRSGVLKVVIMGSSVTAGCGGRDPLPLCHLGHSWARRFHEALLRELRHLPGWTARLETRIYYKNAVAWAQRDSTSQPSVAASLWRHPTSTQNLFLKGHSP